MTNYEMSKKIEKHFSTNGFKVISPSDDIGSPYFAHWRSIIQDSESGDAFRVNIVAGYDNATPVKEISFTFEKVKGWNLIFNGELLTKVRKTVEKINFKNCDYPIKFFWRTDSKREREKVVVF